MFRFMEKKQNKKKYCDKKELKLFLKNVACGKQEAAKSMLKKNPSLLLGKGDVEDLSHRIFYQITAFQYALWALDFHMWDMLLDFFINQKDALSQYNEIQTNGVQYTKPSTFDRSKIKEKHYDFSPLIDALTNYIENHHCNSSTHLETFAKKVISEQDGVPAHVANEYCREDRSFKPKPTFNENTLPRSIMVKNDIDFVSWYSPIKIKMIVRGNEARATRASFVRLSSVEFDRDAMVSLSKTRKNELNALHVELTSRFVVWHPAPKK